MTGINQHGNTHRLHNRSGLVGGTERPGAHVFGGSVGEVVGVKCWPVSCSENVPIADSHNNRVTVLRLKRTSVLCQLLEDVPLEVAVNRQVGSTAVDGLFNQSGGSRQSNAVGTLLICCHAILSKQALVLSQLDATEGFIATEHSGQVCRHRPKGIGALADQINLQPRYIQFPQGVFCRRSDPFNQVGELGRGIF